MENTAQKKERSPPEKTQNLGKQIFKKPKGKKHKQFWRKNK